MSKGFFFMHQNDEEDCNTRGMTKAYRFLKNKKKKRSDNNNYNTDNNNTSSFSPNSYNNNDNISSFSPKREELIMKIKKKGEKKEMNE